MNEPLRIKKNGRPNLTGLPLARRFFLQYEAELNSGCWLWSGPVSSAGYGSLTVENRTVAAHRIGWLLRHGRLPESGLCHRCDTPLCVNPDHLFEGTNLDNMADMYAKGRDRHACGEANANARLTQDSVRQIRASNLRTAVLAAQYGVSQKTIQEVAARRSWRHVR